MKAVASSLRARLRTPCQIDELLRSASLARRARKRATRRSIPAHFEQTKLCTHVNFGNDDAAAADIDQALPRETCNARGSGTPNAQLPAEAASDTISPAQAAA